MSKKNRTARAGVSLSANAAAFDAALRNGDVETIADQPSPMLADQMAFEDTEAEQDASGVLDVETASTEAETLPVAVPVAVEAETVAASEDAANVDAPRHITAVTGQRDYRVYGIGEPAIGGRCHRAWQLLDSMVVLDADRNVISIPSDKAGRLFAPLAGLLPGGVAAEYSNWKKRNGFHLAAHKYTAYAIADDGVPYVIA